MKEARLWEWLRERLQSGHFTRVESDCSPGLPDVNYCVERSEGWIELKAAKRATGAPFRVRGGLRPAQIRWINTHTAHGGVVWIIVSVGPSVHTLPGSLANDFNQMTVEQWYEESHWTVENRLKTTERDFINLTRLLRIR